ncbi:MAG: hypothetical protein HYR66_01255 [Sphingobacteriales bacterium]|nr:hypothetical protein [Sphingobacteriales bacterium]MBI3719343.1 hypothetical protein [Sphingobacteriales bacterium]
MNKTKLLLYFLFTLFYTSKSFSQTVTDTIPVVTQPIDTVLRIKNLNPYFTLHVDSALVYQLEINKDQSKYYWYLKNSPVGLRLNKDNGLLSFKADKNYFLSGKLKYDYQYKALIGVQNLNNPEERVDTSFVIVFYNTDIVVSKVKPSVSSTLTVDEGDTVAFKLQCEDGNFPIENITFFANMPLKNYSPVSHCNDEFNWSPPYDFVKETDSGRVKILNLVFVGTNKFLVRDTANVRIIVRDALNYPLAVQEYNGLKKNINTYILQLKYTFLQLDKKIKKVKNTRTTFDITGSTTALTGSILASSADNNSQKVGKILPSIGVSLVPIKEAVSPQKIYDQNQASLIRGSIKRLEYMMNDNMQVGEKDPDLVKKMNKLKEELKQIQIQLIDVPLELASNMTPEELDAYFNSPRVNKKYRLRKK